MEVFDRGFFDNSSKEWRKNKVKYANGRITFPKTGLIYYTTNSDSPIQFNEVYCKAKYPNAIKWAECTYISARGVKCFEQVELTDKQLANPEYDYEIYTAPMFCEIHCRYEKKEMQKRIKHLEDCIPGVQIDNDAGNCTKVMNHNQV